MTLDAGYMIPATVPLRSTARRPRVAVFAALAAMAVVPAASAAERFTAPQSGESLAPGSIVEVRWTPLCDRLPAREIDEAEIVLSLDGGRTFPVRVTPELKPCSAAFLWKVPALPAAHARLALRAGEEERDADERIEILSADFRILPDPDGRVEQLRRRAAEWWTPSAPAMLSAEDLLENTMSPAGREIVPPGTRSEAAVFPTSPNALRIELAPTAVAPVRLAGRPISRLAAARSAGAPTPLRL